MATDTPSSGFRSLVEQIQEREAPPREPPRREPPRPRPPRAAEGEASASAPVTPQTSAPVRGTPRAPASGAARSEAKGRDATAPGATSTPPLLARRWL